MTTGRWQLFAGSKELLNTVVTLLREVHEHGQNTCDPLTLHIHQFGHTALYAPVYMAFESILRACAARADDTNANDWVRVQYSSHEPDSEVEASVMREGPWRAGGRAVLHLGLSEVTTRRRAPVQDLLVEKPIVKRLPLWGVALADNPKIAKLKRPSQAAGTLRANTGFEELRQLFVGKLSLVQPQNGDLMPLDNGELISVSIYEEGSTAYAFFRKYLEANGQDFSALKVLPVGNGFEDEFDKLMNGDVDIAMTVQPWRALRLAQQERKKIEIVYTHLGRPEPVTSLYVCRDPRDQVQLWASFLGAVGALVQEHVGTLYDCGTHSLDLAYRQYMQAAERHVQLSGQSPTTNIGPRLETAHDFQSAMQLLSDSRVYYYDLPNEKANLKKQQEAVAIALNCRLNRYFGDVANRDPVYRCSIAAHLVRRAADWHRDTPLRALGCGESIRIFADVATTFGIRFSAASPLSAIRNEWCMRRPANTLPHVYNQCSNDRPKEEPWRIYLNEHGDRVSSLPKAGDRQVDFTPWMHEDVLKNVLMHLNSQFGQKPDYPQNRQLKVERFFADVLVLGKISSLRPDMAFEGYEGLSWLWIEYHRDNPQEVPHNKFFDENPFGRLVLNAWYVNTRQSEPVRRLFERQGHGTLRVQNRVPTISIDTPVERVLHPTNKQAMSADEGLLFTFRVAGIENTTGLGMM